MQGIGPQMIEVPSPDHPNCRACKLFESCNSPFMPMEADQSNVLFIGEAPGGDEDEQGQPFVGRSGEVLRGVVDDLGLDAAYTNAVRCRPPNNKKPTAKQMKLCRPFVLQDIEIANTETVVILGATALKSVLSENGVLEWRGSIINKDNRNYFIALHPAAILWGRGSDETRTEWVEDMFRVADIIDGETIEPADRHYEYIYVDTSDKAQNMLADIREEGRCAMDLEFKWLEADKPKNTILVASFAISNKAWAVPIWHDESPFLGDDEQMFAVLEVIDEICLDDGVGKIGHNFKIDYLMTRLHLGIDIYGIEGDTMLLSQTIDSRPKKHGLKHLANRHLGMYGYDQELEDYKRKHKEADYTREYRVDGVKKKGHYGNVPLEVLWFYAAKDAAATWLIEEKLLEMATEQQLNIYRELVIPCISTFTEMELNGLKPDLDMVRKYKKAYETETDRLLRELRQHDAVRKVEDDLNREVREQILDLSEKFKAASMAVVLEKSKKKNEKLRKKAANLKKRLEGKKGKLRSFNPRSNNQVREVIYKYMGFKTTIETQTGSPSVSADAIRWIDDPWIDTYKLWTKYDTALSRYLNNIVDDWRGVDGRVRSSYNIVGTVTGRTSSSNPNLQNISNPGKEPGTLLERYPIKNSFTHTWQGGCLYDVDYGAIEMRVAASLSGSASMIRMFNTGEDLHTFTASRLYGVPIEEVTAFQRQRAKNANWTFLFGGSAYALMRDYGLSEKEANTLESSWLAIFPDVTRFGKYVVERTRDLGYSESAFGRRRYIPFIKNADPKQISDAERQAKNHPIQSTANDLLLMSLNTIRDIGKLHDMRSKLVNTVHDSILFDVFPGELGDLHDLVEDVMVNIRDYADELFPSFSFDWLKVPLAIDAEVGTHYGSMKHYGG